MNEAVYVYRKDAPNTLLCVSKEHYEGNKDSFTLSVASIVGPIPTEPTEPVEKPKIVKATTRLKKES